MLHDLANDGGFVTLKQAAEDREYETEKGCQKPAEQQKTTDDDDCDDDDDDDDAEVYSATWQFCT